MKKSILLFIMISVIVLTNIANVKANSNDYVSVEITSQSDYSVYPGYETTIIASVTNNTQETLTDLVVYITMVDLTKNMTVNLEDYNADVPVLIATIQPNESVTIELPIVLVYPDTFHLYVSVASKDTLSIVSSDSVTVEIMTQSNIDPTLVQVASIATPIIVLGAFITLFYLRRKSVKYEQL